MAFHEHNERARTGNLINKLQRGESIALISDAGTPLLSDPGYYLVRAAHEHDIPVVPVPGASALLAALVAAGLPTDRFVFEGFLPNKTVARCKYLASLKKETGTLVFYEAPHRILACLQDMVEVFGAEREAVLARELTKTYETIRRDKLARLVEWVAEDLNQQRGEIVLVVAGGRPQVKQELSADVRHVLTVLLSHLPVKQAATITAEITGEKKNRLYEAALKLGADN